MYKTGIEARTDETLFWTGNRIRKKEKERKKKKEMERGRENRKKKKKKRKIKEEKERKKKKKINRLTKKKEKRRKREKEKKRKREKEKKRNRETEKQRNREKEKKRKREKKNKNKKHRHKTHRKKEEEKRRAQKLVAKVHRFPCQIGHDTRHGTGRIWKPEVCGLDLSGHPTGFQKTNEIRVQGSEFFGVKAKPEHPTAVGALLLTTPRVWIDGSGASSGEIGDRCLAAQRCSPQATTQGIIFQGSTLRWPLNRLRAESEMKRNCFFQPEDEMR